MKRLLLLGGGHTHVEVIRRFGIDPPPDTRIQLLSPERYTAYSGMLPGYVAGHYDFHDCHIDLARLCEAARVTLRLDAAVGIDPAARIIASGGGDRHDYDLLSIDIGSTQPTRGIPGAPEQALRVKPVGHFIDAWDRFRAAARAQRDQRRIVVIGGGPAGVELALAMQYRLGRDGLAGHVELHIVTDAPDILSGHPRRVRREFETILHERGIVLHSASRVVRLEPGVLHHERAALPADLFVLANGAAAPDWLRESGLGLDDRGFVAIQETLQCVSHPDVFAAGDVATMKAHPRPKSGVFAVRQGPPLAENLRRALAQRPLKPYRPQKNVLALISTGDRRAVASWNGIGFSGAWVWRWKNRIDCRFMATYRIDSGEEKARL